MSGPGPRPGSLSTRAASYAASLLLSLYLTACGASPSARFPAPTTGSAAAPHAAQPEPTPLVVAGWGVTLNPVAPASPYSATQAKQQLEPKIAQQMLAEFKFPEASSPVVPRASAKTHRTADGAPPNPSSTAERCSASPNAGAPPKVARLGPAALTRPDQLILVEFEHAVVTGPLGVALTASPFSLSPPLPGEWRWVSECALAFVPDAALPMATEFEVQRNPSAAAFWGTAAQASPRKWLLRSTPPQVILTYPAAQQSRISTTPSVYLQFNQRVDPKALLPFITFAAAKQTIRARLTTPAEDLSDISERAGQRGNASPIPNPASAAGTFVVIRPEQPLPQNTAVTLTVAAGAPSLEGPLLGMQPHTVPFRTRGPLEVVAFNCQAPTPCEAGETWKFELSNLLPEPGDLNAIFDISPAAEFDGFGHQTHENHSELNIRVKGRAGQTYRVTLSDSLRDVDGQPLSGPRTFELHVASAPAASELRANAVSNTVENAELRVSSEFSQTLDPKTPPVFRFRSKGIEQVTVDVYRVKPSDWPQFIRYVDFQRFYHGTQPKNLPGSRVHSRTFTFAGEPNGWRDSELSLAPYLKKRLGHLIVVVRAPEVKQKALWIQSTRIGLEYEGQQTAASIWTADLNTGSPLSDVAVSVLGQKQQVTTQADGLTTLPLINARNEQALLAVKGSDSALVRFWGTPWDVEGHSRIWRDWRLEDLGSQFFPGGEVHLQGKLDLTAKGEQEAHPGHQVRFRLFRNYKMSNPGVFSSGTVSVNADGVFELRFTLPEEHVERVELELGLEGPNHTRDEELYTQVFSVQEAPQPTRRVTFQPNLGVYFDATTWTPVYDVGTAATLRAKLVSPAGAPIPGAALYYRGIVGRARFAPPGWDGYAFGAEELAPRSDAPGNPIIRELTHSEPFAWQGLTDTRGFHELRLQLASAQPFAREVSLAVSPSPFEDSTGRDAALPSVNQTHLLVLPAAVDVGVRPVANFFLEGQPIDVDVIVTDHQGHPVPGMSVVVDSGQVGEPRPAASPACQFTSTQQPFRCRLAPGRTGKVTITASVEDALSRTSRSEVSVFVPSVSSPSLSSPRLALLADKPRYAAGDAANLLLVAPVAPSTAWMRIRDAQGQVTQRILQLKERISVLPISGDLLSTDSNVAVVLAGRLPERGAAERGTEAPASSPVVLKAQVSLPVQPETLTLDVVRRPTPNGFGSIALGVRVRDGQGKAIPNATVVVTATESSDPKPRVSYYLPALYSPPSKSVQLPNRASVRLAEVSTDNNGAALATFKLAYPTRSHMLRIHAQDASGRGASTERFEPALIEWLDDMAPEVRVDPIPFLNVGDSADVQVHVYHGAPYQRWLRLVATTENAQLDSPNGYEMQLSPGRQVDATFRLTAKRPGPLQLGVVTSIGKYGELPARGKQSTAITFAPPETAASQNIEVRAPSTDPASPAANIALSQWYEAAGATESVKRDPGGEWSLTLGSRVRVVTALHVRETLRQVELEIPVPAGLKAVTRPNREKQGHRELASSVRKVLLSEEAPRNATTSDNDSFKRVSQDPNTGNIAATVATLPPGIYLFSFEAEARTAGRFSAQAATLRSQRPTRSVRDSAPLRTTIQPR